MVSPPRLETERLVLRGFSEADLQPLVSFYSNETTSKFVGGVSEPWEVWRRMASYIGHWQLRGYGPFALEDKSSGNFAGYCGPWYPHGWPEPELGWGLMPEFQGRGLVVEAAKRCLSYVYDDLGWNTAISAIDPDNAASRRVAERLGATYESHKPVSFFTADIYRHQSPQDFRNSLNS